MKQIDIDDELYHYLVTNTQSIGESASAILRRLLNLPTFQQTDVEQSSLPSQPSKQQVETRQEMMPLKKTTKQSEQSIELLCLRVRQLLTSEAFLQENRAVWRFLAILRVLYRTDPESFAQATESLQGRTRVYFARDEATLLMAGQQTKPKQIPDTPYWVITNTNSGRKMLMLESAMQSMHLPETLIDEVRSFFKQN